jgi:SAM-dependent MidA family methyltransferase
VRAAAAVQQLTSPAEMGELFKVLALATDTAEPGPGFRLADMRRRL